MVDNSDKVHTQPNTGLDAEHDPADPSDQFGAVSSIKAICPPRPRDRIQLTRDFFQIASPSGSVDWRPDTPWITAAAQDYGR